MTKGINKLLMKRSAILCLILLLGCMKLSAQQQRFFNLTVQEGCTTDMLYKVDEIISYISRYFTLKTGDIIYTGCPSGCGPVHINDHLEGYIEERKVLDFNCK